MLFDDVGSGSISSSAFKCGQIVGTRWRLTGAVNAASVAVMPRLGIRLSLSAGVAGSIAFTLVACGPSAPSDPPQLLVDAVESGTIDDKAVKACSEIYPSETYLAALDSTAGEVRELARSGPGGSTPDIQDLPDEADTYIAICVSELPEGNPLKSKYAALWMTEGSTATGFVAVWNP